ncbi:DUF3081 domain-containing protein [Zobellella maritima]|uniref:DUF3081 domain-containing protein n=1 Tax=Zobellella maritima TaxID=2059725 RepID=UPI000E301885|nr:DUF3081 domain-containing protein [Zobellella maritima]
MRNELDNRVVLDVFEKVQRFGEPHEHGHILEGIVATSDFDGYSVNLSGSGVSLQLNFHQSYRFDYASDKAKEQFMAKLDYIHRHFNNPAG